MNYQREKLIRFQHCDPAGIVFYPRYMGLLNEVVEDWFSEGVGIGFPELHDRLRLGVPTARLECDFLKPSRHGEVLNFRLWITKLGRTSIDVSVRADCGDQPRLRARLLLVLLDLDSYRSVPLDEGWRQRFEPFVDNIPRP
ncbi:MAG: acyl-CoA thioesterase [Burkholderiales bacterium]|nr:MAG: acyl-CoA thioesterase [Burkholderiales bacterium]